MWTPVELSSAALADRKQRPYRVVARLREGVSRERAEVELRAIAERLARMIQTPTKVFRSRCVRFVTSTSATRVRFYGCCKELRACCC